MDSELPKQTQLQHKSKSRFLLSEYLGADLGKITNELDKLMLIIEKGQEITL